ncbi:MAG: hypothetical protein FJ387_26245 [Verrucomicrobia bacterium]|nr:hypothetical protein [Verrucomicrobiota bacterium]
MKPTLCLLALTALLVVACDRSAQRPDPRPAHSHHHEPPHGGTVVVLGNEEFHLEVLAHPTEGRLQVYFLDGHMDNFIRLPDALIPTRTMTAAVTARNRPREPIPWIRTARRRRGLVGGGSTRPVGRAKRDKCLGAC